MAIFICGESLRDGFFPVPHCAPKETGRMEEDRSLPYPLAVTKSITLDSSIAVDHHSGNSWIYIVTTEKHAQNTSGTLLQQLPSKHTSLVLGTQCNGYQDRNKGKNHNSSLLIPAGAAMLPNVMLAKGVEKN